ncbi:MAG: UbiA family prenyltransferase [Candidatus Edwardsbacteria bacterium]|nr:UbiA family prenyltransferase [Candidatus Edwardsbacteria bacterium]
MNKARRPSGAMGRLLDAIASAPHGLAWSWSLVLASCFGRAFLEGACESSGQLGFALEPLQSQLMVFLHLPAFFVALFLLIILSVSALTAAPVERITRLVAAGSPVIMVPVLIDALVSGSGYQLYYLRDLGQIADYLRYTFVPWRGLPGASPGIRIEVALGCAAAALVCWQQTGSLLRGAAGFAAVFLCCVFAGSLPILIAAGWAALAGSDGSLPAVFSPGGLVQTDTRKYALVFMALAVGLGAAWLRLCRPGTARSLLRSSRPLRAIHYAGMVGLGFLAGWLTVGRAFTMAFANPFDSLFPIGAAAAVVCAFQSAVLLNDYFDRDIDRLTGKANPLSAGEMAGAELLGWAAGYAALAVALAAALGQAPVLIVLFSLALSVAYSAPPLRLRRFYPLSTLLIALAALAACWLGFSAFGGARTLALFPPRLGWFIMVCFGLSFATKDLNDAAGDRAAGILTLPTMLGERRGRAVTAGLVLTAYAAGPLIIGIPWLLAAAVPAGAATAWLVLRRPVREGLVFLVYFLFGAALVTALWLDPGPLQGGPEARLRGGALQGLEDFHARDYARAAPGLAAAAAQDRQFLWPAARSLYETGSLAAATLAVGRLLAGDPLSVKGRYLAGRVALAAGDVDSAEAAYRRGRDLGLNEFHEHLGDLRSQRGGLEEADRHYRDALLAAGPDAGLLSKLAVVRLRRRDTTAATELLWSALRREPGHGRSNALMGELALSQGRPAEAVRRLEAASQAMPRSADVRERLGAARLAAGDWAGAEAGYLAAVALDPGHGPSWSGLARLYLMAGRTEAAAEAMAGLAAAGGGPTRDVPLAAEEPVRD